jgi:ABC-type glycerol-3-phosphate transport system permease component
LRQKAVWKLGEGFGNGCNVPKEVRVLEFSINSKQAIAVIWTIIAVALSLVVVLALGYPLSYGSWPLSIGLFFALLLVMVLPAYLLIALWQILSKD